MAEARILSHMNKDHSLSIEDYLIVYGKVSPSDKISNIKMSEITLNSMTITFKHEDIEFDVSKIIAFEPPLEEFSQARVKLVEMAKYAAQARGLSHFQIKDFKYPGFFGWLLLAIVNIPIAVYFFPFLLNNSVASQFLSPSSVSWLQKYCIHIFYVTIFIHLTEAYFILLPKLEKYRVPTEFKIEWFISNLFQGYPAIKRFNNLVAEHGQH